MGRSLDYYILFKNKINIENYFNEVVRNSQIPYTDLEMLYPNVTKSLLFADYPLYGNSLNIDLKDKDIKTQAIVQYKNYENGLCDGILIQIHCEALRLLLWEDEEEVPKRLFDFFKYNLKPDLLVFRNNHRWENDYLF